MEAKRQLALSTGWRGPRACAEQGHLEWTRLPGRGDLGWASLAPMRESWELALMLLCCGPSSYGHGLLPLDSELESQEHAVVKFAVA